jgi:DNA-binding CsgD family transcriptional regulator
MPKASANWKTLARHPISARYNDWPSDLRDQVIANLKGGWTHKHSVVTIHENMVLDGWQRLQCAIAADVKPPFQQLPEGVDPEEFVSQVNDDRRHESMEQMAERVKARRERAAAKSQAGDSNRKIAEQEGVSETTIRNDLAVATAQGAQLNPPGGMTTGRDGRKRPAPQKPKKPKKPKAGAVKKDSEWDQSAFDVLLRCIDNLHRPHNLIQSNGAETLRLYLKEFCLMFQRRERELNAGKEAA